MSNVLITGAVHLHRRTVGETLGIYKRDRTLETRLGTMAQMRATREVPADGKPHGPRERGVLQLRSSNEHYVQAR